VTMERPLGPFHRHLTDDTADAVAVVQFTHPIASQRVPVLSTGLRGPCFLARVGLTGQRFTTPPRAGCFSCHVTTHSFRL
jgi:hypothetical protein